ncbi:MULTISPECIES: porin [Cupriavidus]
MKRTMIAAAVLAVAGTPALAAPAGVSPAVVQQLEKKIDDMAGQLDALKAELRAVREQNAAMATQQQTQARQQADQTAQVAQLQASQETLQQAAAKPSPLDNLSLFGYGEIGYSRPSRNTNDTRADIGRAVFGFGYRFDDKTRFASEFEVEHAIASSSDAGEFEVEQFYVDHMFTDKVGLTAGVFLMPVGLINEHHEPTAYYGVYRNFIETLIIPSTWREGGFALHGNTDIGLDWNVGVTTGLDLSKWNFTPETPLYGSALELQNNGSAPFQATHQEMSLANAKNASQYLSLNYRGVPGLLLGGSVFTGNANPAAGAGSQRSTLWETHARWTPGKWDLSALYAQGYISNTAKVNAQFPGTANPMPASFYGWYLQAAYNLWQHGSYRAVPFARFERYNMGARYEGLAPGFSAVPSQPVTASGAVFPKPYDTVWTAGLNFYLNPNVVFKVDYQRFRVNRDFSRFDLGLGIYF